MRVSSAPALLACVVAPSLDQRDTFQLPLTTAAGTDVSAMVLNTVEGRLTRHRSKDESEVEIRLNAGGRTKADFVENQQAAIGREGDRMCIPQRPVPAVYGRPRRMSVPDAGTAPFPSSPHAAC